LITYRKLRKSDVSQVQEVALKAWKYTYRKIYTPSNIRKFVSRYYSNERYEKVVFPTIKKGHACFHVALDGNRIIGYSHVGKSKAGWELLRIYLLPRYIGKGIGGKLLHLNERFLRKRDVRRYFVYAHAGNRLGILFYGRNGFVRMKRKDEGPTSICFVKRLH
jgi:GNAT superfamily N-acetyltransferase